MDNTTDAVRLARAMETLRADKYIASRFGSELATVSQLAHRANAAAPQQPPPVGVTDAMVERVARTIYEQWAKLPGYVGWVDGGNSDKQYEARTLARWSIYGLGEYAHPQQPAPSVSDLERMKQQARFRAACYALVQLVEGHPVHRWVDGDGLRLKDTPEWVAFYTITGAMRNGLHAAPVSEPAPSVSEDRP